MNTDAVSPPPDKTGLNWLQVVLIVAGTVVVTVLLTLWIIRTYVFPADFEPVALSPKEEQVLAAKLERLESMQTPSGEQIAPGEIVDGKLAPEVYSEDPSKRALDFTERELNALLAKNTELAERVAIDLSDRLISAKLLIPMDEDFPVLGGRVLRIKTGMVFDYKESRPVVKLQGVTLMGVPLPNAWLGGLKNVDLVAEFGGDEGFWRAFADGVEGIEVKEGRLQLRLKE